ncbi:hypothetical protein J4216_06835 [Candidatus Woesearchaeota archaeon]|nr:hypothetical protein [Candidatus Woesearchaeota archaeon]
MGELDSLIELMKYHLETVETEIVKLERYNNNEVYTRSIISEIRIMKNNLNSINRKKVKKITESIRIISRRLVSIIVEIKDEKIKTVIDKNLREFLALLMELDNKI